MYWESLNGAYCETMKGVFDKQMGVILQNLVKQHCTCIVFALCFSYVTWNMRQKLMTTKYLPILIACSYDYETYYTLTQFWKYIVFSGKV